MGENKYKETHMRQPIECHSTAAWANVNELKPDSGVHIPEDIQVMNAKEYVDENQK